MYPPTSSSPDRSPILRYRWSHGGLSPTSHGLSPFPSYINSSLILSGESFNSGDSLNRTCPVHMSDFLLVPVLRKRSCIALMVTRACKDIEAALEKTGTRRMIMGHTPDFENNKSYCGEKIVIIIDTSMSESQNTFISGNDILPGISRQYVTGPV
ncbi:uncharacterized protein EV420DRAFT_1474932 [Desarmillaria tabescens]|uniref:Uncharacterized protein n=1 Tax=Armillaria tabescens TaxID=1929756 RepID=A0AA39TTP7_ARMTA|nr:uncharacterized protein EV420DRAFT_1474932 [Desarmillaria tabescens]KAK0466138.1 hypothetical protein EV420DRAFT_1474932 [Desarmillaria tabescens]